MSGRLERDIQAATTKESIFLGLLPIRINVVGRKGWPDYGYLYRGRICFIEFKKPGEKPEPLQLYVHKQLRESGAEVFVVDNEDYGTTLLKEWKRHVDQELERLRPSNGGDARSGSHL
jgi:hypothetical protein